MYVHCNKCDWSQDDFYDESYNPAKWLSKEFDSQLFGKDTKKLSEVLRCKEFLYDKPIRSDMTVQENIARWYEHFADCIRNMKWTTYRQYSRDPNKTCPLCGSTDLSTD